MISFSYSQKEANLGSASQFWAVSCSFSLMQCQKNDKRRILFLFLSMVSKEIGTKTANLKYKKSTIILKQGGRKIHCGLTFNWIQFFYCSEFVLNVARFMPLNPMDLSQTVIIKAILIYSNLNLKLIFSIIWYYNVYWIECQI